MKVFLKLKDPETLVYPVVNAANEKAAIQHWGKDGHVEAKIQRNEDPNTLADKLVDGQVVWDQTRIDQSKVFNDVLRAKKRDQARVFRRSKAMHDKLAALDGSVATKDWNDLTAFERKLLFKIGGGPSDAELGLDDDEDIVITE